MNDAIVLELTLILKINPQESDYPNLWPLQEMVARPGVELVDAGFRILDPCPEEIN